MTGTVLVLAAGGGDTQSLITRALAIRPAQILGDLSYGYSATISNFSGCPFVDDT